MNAIYILLKAAKKLFFRAFSLFFVLSLFFGFPIFAEWLANLIL